MFEHIKPLDLKAQRRNRIIIVAVLCMIPVCGFLYYEFKNWPEERRVNQFFAALQSQEYQKAYEIWRPAPSYKFADFQADWGPKGVVWPVKHFHVIKSHERGSGVIITTKVNDTQDVDLWVEKNDKSLSFPP